MMRTNLVYFSPTKTTEKVVYSIAQGIGTELVEKINITKPGKIKQYNFSAEDLVIFGVPVYVGRIPVVALERLKRFKAEKAKAVLVAVYGNRDYDDTLLEMKNLFEAQGFVVLAAAAFIGQHSYSSQQYPIAEGRPNPSDLKIAENFGKDIFAKFSKTNPELKVPGNFPYKERVPKMIIKPHTDMNLCTLCGVCAHACPVGAIKIEKNCLEIDEQKCIYCHACVRFCPQSAQTFTDPRLRAFTEKLYSHFNDPKQPEIFI